MQKKIEAVHDAAEELRYRALSIASLIREGFSERDATFIIDTCSKIANDAVEIITDAIDTAPKDIRITLGSVTLGTLRRIVMRMDDIYKLMERRRDAFMGKDGNGEG